MKVQNLIYGTLFLACSMQASLADNRIDQQLPGAPELAGYGEFSVGVKTIEIVNPDQIDVLKIDRSFVREIPQNTEDTAIVNTIISMGHNMNLKVIAEGVETQDQRNCLSKLGCELAQGFYFSRPLPADEFLKFINKHANY